VGEGYDAIKVDPVGMTADGVWGGAHLEGILSSSQLDLFVARTRAIRDAVRISDLVKERQDAGL